MNFVELTEREVKGLKFGCENFLQSWEMYQRYQKLGREAYFVGVKDGEKIVSAGLMSARPWRLGKKIFRVPGGWLMDYDGENYAEILDFTTREAKEFCRKRGGMALEIAPNITMQPRDMYNQIVPGQTHIAVKETLERLGYKYLGEFEQVKWIFTLKVRGKKPEELFSAFRTGHRQWVRRAEREGVRIRELALDELGILKEIAAEAGERHGFKDPEMDYYRSMKEAFGDRVKFLVAEIPTKNLENWSVSDKGYTPLAASMFVYEPNEIVYLYSGSVKELQKYGGAHLMQWRMIQETLKSGREKYNFYGVYPVEGNGVYFFKQGFRGEVEELLGTFILPIGWLGKLYCTRLKEHEYNAVH